MSQEKPQEAQDAQQEPQSPATDDIRRVMPVSEQITVQLDEPWAGWEATVAVGEDVPVAMLSEVQEALMNADSGDVWDTADAMRLVADFISAVLIKWNFVDHRGRRLPPTRENVRALPASLLGELFRAVVDSIVTAPKV